MEENGAPAEANPRQSEAIGYSDGPLQVIAGPGTGKTRVITEKVLHLVRERGYRPGSILALTFTEKAAGEMAHRIRAALARAAIRGQPHVSTFHSFCLDLVREYSERMGYTGPMALLVGPLYVQYIADHMDELVTEHLDLVGKVPYIAGEMAEFVSRCHDEGLVGKAIVPPVDRWLAGLPEKDREAALRVRDYAASLPRLQALQKRDNIVTYGDLLTLAVRLLEENGDVLREVRDRYRYVLVDEFQDDNISQFHLVNLLAGESGRVFVVGDEDQSIHQFRGARMNLMQDFHDYWKARAGLPPLRRVDLDENYRSTDAIIQVGQALIRHNTQRFSDKSLRRADGSTVTGPSEVRLVQTDTEAAERAFIVREITTLIREAHRAPGDIAILCRSLNHVRNLTDDLRRAGVELEVVGGGGLFANTVVREVLAWLKALDSPGEDEAALHRVLRMQGFGLPHADQRALGKTAWERRVPLMTVLENLEKDPASVRGISERGRDLLLKFMGLFRRFHAEERPQGRPDVMGLVNEILGMTGLARRLRVDTVRGRQDLSAVGGLLQVAENYQENYPYPGLHGFVRFLDLLEELGHDETVGEPSGDRETVKVMNIHQAKGREFPVVFVPGLSEHFPPQKSGRTWPQKFMDHLSLAIPPEAAHIEEERRVLYVGLTRAMEELVVSYYDSRDGKPVRRPSPFLNEVAVAPQVRRVALTGESLSATLQMASDTSHRGAASGDATLQMASDTSHRGAASGDATPPPGGAPLTRRAMEDRLFYMVSRLGAGVEAGAARENLKEAVALVAGLLAGGPGADAARLREVLAGLGFPPGFGMPAREEAAPAGVTGDLHLSPSSLNIYAGCPRQFLYKQVLHIPEAGGFPARFGTAVHSALETFHRRHRRAERALLPELLGIVDGEVAKVDFRGGAERAQASARSHEILARFIEEEAARDATVLEVEWEFSMALGEDVLLSGKVDRLDELPGGKVRIIDYKTGGLESARYYLEEDFQMPVYAWAVRESLGRDLGSVEVVGLKELNELKRGPKLYRQVLPWDDGSKNAITPELLGKVKERIHSIVRGIREGRFEAAPEEKRCGWCAYRLLCEKAWGTTEG